MILFTCRCEPKTRSEFVESWALRSLLLDSAFGQEVLQQGDQRRRPSADLLEPLHVLVGLASRLDLLTRKGPLRLRLRHPAVGPVPRRQGHVRVRDARIVPHHLFRRKALGP